MNEPEPESAPPPEPPASPPVPPPAPADTPAPAPPPDSDSGIGWGPDRQPPSPDDELVDFGPTVEAGLPAATPHPPAPDASPADERMPEPPGSSTARVEDTPRVDPEQSIAEGPTPAVEAPPAPVTEPPLPEPPPPVTPPATEAEAPLPEPSPVTPPEETQPVAPPAPSDAVPVAAPAQTAPAGVEPPVAGPPPPGGQPPTDGTARRRRILLISAVAGAAVLIAGVVVAIILINAGGGTPGPSATAAPQASDTPVAQTPTRTTTEVPASVAWTGTGVECAPGLVIDVAATGSVVPGDGITNEPNGVTSAFLDSNVVADIQHAALIGRLGSGDPFLVGSERTIVCPETEDELELGVNDDGLDNNAGTFDAVVTTRPDVDPASLAAMTVEVPGSVAWTPTGITCVTGDLYRASATGSVTFEGATDEQDAGPDGVQPAPDGTMQRGNVLTTASHRGLIARVGEGEPFAAGSSVTISCPADGVLEFGPNDSGVGDNLGAFTVTVTRALPTLP